MTIKDYSSTAASNTAINGVSIAGTAPVSNMDDGLRNIMADISNWTDSDTLASGTTTDLGSVAGMYVTVSGTATITGFGTLKAGMVKYVYFSGAGEITHNATSMILPAGASITRAAGDVAVFVSEGSGNWRCLHYLRKGAQWGTKGADIASGATTDIGAATGDYVVVTGTTTITSFGTAAAGTFRRVRFDSALTLTNNANIILRNGASTTTFAGGIMEFVSEGGGVWRQVCQTPSRGTWTPTVTASSGTFGSTTASGKYTKIENMVFVDIVINIISLGTASGNVICTLPFANNSMYQSNIPGVETNVTGKTAIGRVVESSNLLGISFYDNTGTAGASHVLRLTGQFSV